MNFQNILVAVDRSDYSIKVLEYAGIMAKAFNCKLTVLHVISSSIRYEFLNTENPKFNSINEIIQSSYIEAEKWLNDFKERINVEFKTEVIIASDSIVSEIVEYSQRENIDLIIVGTRGRTGFKKLLLGSVASGVINFSHCPVLVVR